MDRYEITQPGVSEHAKAVVHLGLFGLACVTLAYNLTALAARPARHLAVNALVYLGLALFEAHHTLGHLSRKDA